MENAEEILHYLEDFTKRKPKTIPQELNEYLAYVARTGDPVYQWCHVKNLFKEKLLSVITDFYETTPSVEIPPCPNVDPFNYDIMKNSLLERLDSFTSAPFTVQRICELLTFPRKQYNRVDKFMRAIEKNILVVSTREPGIQRHSETENGEANEPIVNGSDNNSEYNVDVEMEDMSWKENNQQQTSEPQPGSSDTHITVDDIEARLKAKQDAPMENRDKTTTQYESVTPPELNVTTDDSPEHKPNDSPTHDEIKPDTEKQDQEPSSSAPPPLDNTSPKKEEEKKTEPPITLLIPEIKVDDAEMTEQKLLSQSNAEKQSEDIPVSESKAEVESPQAIDESSSDSKEEVETKHISEVSTSSEESSSSSDNTDASSNSPKTDEGHIDMQEESNAAESNAEKLKDSDITEEPVQEAKAEEPTPKIKSEDYSISDVNSVLPQPPVKESEEITSQKDIPEPMVAEENKEKEEKKVETETSTEKQES